MFKSIKAAKIVVYISLILLVTGIISPSFANASDSTLVALAKKILKGAVGIAIDEAGARILGPTVWRHAKRIFMPVYDEVEKRYPNMLLSERQKERAIEELSNNEQLQNMLLEGFQRLEKGQDLLLAELNRMNKVMEEHGRKITDTHAMTAEILSILKRDRKMQPTETLQEVQSIVDIDSIRQMPPELKIIWKYSTARKYNLNKILENGSAFTPYRYFANGYFQSNGTFNIEPTEYRVVPYGRYEDTQGRTCRKIIETYYAKGNWHINKMTYVLFQGQPKYVRLGKEQHHCRVYGEWHLIHP